MNSKPTYNSGTIKSAAAIISYKEPTMICVNRCVFQSDLKFEAGYGNAVLLLK